MGRPAGVAGRRPRSAAARHLDLEHRAARTVYINFDAELQESKVSEQLPPIDVARYMPAVSTAAPAEQIRQAVAMLKDAKQVLILAGRASRSVDAWNARVALAEALNAASSLISKSARLSRPIIRFTPERPRCDTGGRRGLKER